MFWVQVKIFKILFQFFAQEVIFVNNKTDITKFKFTSDHPVCIWDCGKEFESLNKLTWHTGHCRLNEKLFPGLQGTCRTIMISSDPHQNLELRTRSLSTTVGEI